MWRITPGPSMSASTTRSPGSSRRFGAPLRPPCAWPPAPRAPVGFSNVDRAGVEARVDDGRVGGGIDHRRLDERVGHRLEPLGDPRTVGRDVERDRRALELVRPRPPRPVGAVRTRDECSVRGWWKLTPPARSWIGTAAVVSIASTSSRRCTDGSSPTWRCGSTSPLVGTGHEPHAPVVDVDVVERHPRAERVVREARLPVRLVLVPRDREAALRRLEDQMAPALDGRPRAGRSRRAAMRFEFRHMSVSSTPAMRRSGNSSCPRSGSSSEPYGRATSKQRVGETGARAAPRTRRSVARSQSSSSSVVIRSSTRYPSLGEERDLVVGRRRRRVAGGCGRTRWVTRHHSVPDGSAAWHVRKSISSTAAGRHARGGGSSSRARPASASTRRAPALAACARRAARSVGGGAADLVGGLGHDGELRAASTVARGESSKPTIATSSGTRRPAIAQRAQRADGHRVVGDEQRIERGAGSRAASGSAR